MDISSQVVRRLFHAYDSLSTRIGEIQYAIDKHTNTIHDADERERNQEKVPETPKTVHAVVAFGNETVRDAQTENERQFRVQRSIKRAAWSAFVAASIYALVAAYQGYQMKKATQATEIAATAAQNAAKTASDTFRLTYRPRLKIIGLTPDQSMVNGDLHTNWVDGKLRVTFDAPNTGPFPATDVRFFRYSDVSARERIKKGRYVELPGMPSLIAPKVEGVGSGLAILSENVLGPEHLYDFHVDVSHGYLPLARSERLTHWAMLRPLPAPKLGLPSRLTAGRKLRQMIAWNL